MSKSGEKMQAKWNSLKEDILRLPRTLRPADVLGAIILVLVLLYWPVASYQYVNYDDPNWISHNQHVTNGISIDSLVWAVTGTANSNWCPLANSSFLLESSILGTHPQISHLINFFLHVANVILFLHFLLRFNELNWPVILATLLFAVHPMNVEAVAWVSDRKGLLGVLFILWLLIKYIDFSKKPTRKAYYQIVVLYSLSLASKPTAITVPLMLLLLDIWPLARFGDKPLSTGIKLVSEKFPLVVLAALDAYIAYAFQRETDGVARHPVVTNLETAIVGCARYAANLVWPFDLNVCYLHPGSWPASVVIPALLLLVLISFIVTTAWRREKAFLICWMLFILTLAPVLEIIPAGHCYMADRYAYFPYVWLLIAGCAFLSKFTSRIPHLIFGAMIVTIVMISSTRAQINTWATSITLFDNALHVNRQNPICYVNLALGYDEHLQYELAVTNIEMAISLDPTNPIYCLAAGKIYADTKRFDRAAKYIEMAYDKCRSEICIGSYAAFFAATPAFGRNNQALEAAQLNYVLMPSAQSLDIYSCALASCDSVSEAIYFQRLAVRRDPSNSMYKRHLEMFLSWQAANRHI